MMTVTGITDMAHAEGRAAYYRSRGYKVEICSLPGTIMALYLRCTPLPN